jgi:uncharacterized alkaline shock family protein YloU
MTALPDVQGRLPCGALFADLLDQVAEQQADPKPGHQQRCPHCRAALRELDRLWAPVRQLAAERVTVPASLTRKIMGQVSRLASTTWHVVQPTGRGVTRIASRVVGTIARLAASEVPGVHAALGRSTAPAAAAATERATQAHQPETTAVGITGGTTVIDLAIAVDFGTSIPATADRVRTAVARQLHELAGLDDVDIEITVDDILG